MTMKVSQVQEESWLRTEVQRLAEDNEDLRGSARVWIRMYEQLLRHCSAPPTEAPTSKD